MIAYGNPGSGLVHPCNQPEYVPAPEISTDATGKRPLARRPIVVDGIQYAHRTEAVRATGISSGTLKAHADNGKPFKGHVVKWGDLDAA
jgi:hypothetical protein